MVDAIDGGPDGSTMLVAGAVIGLVGLVAWRITEVPKKIALLDVFTTVTSAWVIMAAAGAIPYLATGTLGTFDEALFESVSGFTTTGATVLRPIEDASAGILFWRSITQWLGGMGVIVLVVAVLPTVGSGGMDLLQAEAPGPTGERLTPRVTQTAQRLWTVYIGFTILVAAAYLAAGMTLYDAVGHAFTTVSTGGFSSYNDSMAAFDSAVIEWIAIVAMFIAGTSFTLLYRLVRGRPGPLLRSVEFRTYCLIVLGATLIVFVIADGAGRNPEGFRDAAFTVLAIISTTGYATADFGLWSQAAQAIILIMIPLGAMAGSTAGGVKMIRVLAVASYAHRETLKQLHPRLVRSVRIGDVVLDDRVANKVLAFFVLALAAFGGYRPAHLPHRRGSDHLVLGRRHPVRQCRPRPGRGRAQGRLPEPDPPRPPGRDRGHAPRPARDLSHPVGPGGVPPRRASPLGGPPAGPPSLSWAGPAPRAEPWAGRRARSPLRSLR